MGLILGVRAHEKIYIDDDWIRIVKVTGRQHFVLENEDGSAFTINGPNDQPQEVIPEVFVSAGMIRSNTPKASARMFIDAPREMQILREASYNTLLLHEEAAYMIETLAPKEWESAAGLIDRLDKAIAKLTRGGKKS
jgi:sRNA-binding carbon storage regulator CsrA